MPWMPRRRTPEALDAAAPPAAAAAPSPEAPPTETLQRSLVELEHRIQVLENAVAGLQDTGPLEQRVTERVVAKLPPPPEPIDPSRPLSLRDIALPIPSAATLNTAVQSSWLVLDLLGDAKNIIIMLVDRRYHMAWLTRLLVLALLAAIATTSLWLPLSSVALLSLGYFIDKAVCLLLSMLLFLLLAREGNRYRTWRAQRRT